MASTLDLTHLTNCCLCPRACGANRASGQRGVCGAHDKLLVARAALHLWEEPPISARAGSGTVFFSNCPLQCVYCQNASIAHRGVGCEITADRLADIFLELQDQDAANINLVTATHYLPWVLYALDVARQQGLSVPIVWNTSGYETPETIRALRGYVDIYLTDFKYDHTKDSNAAQRYSHAPSYFEVATEAIDAMVEQVGKPSFDADGVMLRGVVLRHLLLPERLEDSKRVMSYAWHRWGEAVLYSVMDQYTPLTTFPQFPELNNRTSAEDYEALLCFMDSLGMEDYFWQEGDPAQESFIPPFDATGVLA